MRSVALFALFASTCFALAGCSAQNAGSKEPLGVMPDVVTTAEPEWIPWSIRAGEPVAPDPREKHLTELRRVTRTAARTSVRWSADGKKLIYQAPVGKDGCDQTFVISLGSGETSQVSDGGGLTADGAFYPAGDRLLYASSRAAGSGCAPAAGTEPRGDLDVVSARIDGKDARPLFASSSYDAEVSVSPDRSRLVLTSARDGDPELYTANLDGTRIRRITFAPGHDGGAVFSPDSTKLIWHAARGGATPDRFELWIAGAEGEDARALLRSPRSSKDPSFFPDSRRVLFASDMDAAAGSRGGSPAYAVYMMDPDGPATAHGGPAIERITFAAGNDGSPSFSPDGRYVAFTSTRSSGGENHAYVARWVP